MTDQSRVRTRRRLRRVARLIQALFLRVTVRGQEHIPANGDGPLLILFSHPSSLDGPLVMANFPHEMELVGPGDFALAWPGPWAVRAYGMTLIQRGRADRASLKVMVGHLKAGRILAMAPEGGTWEKRLSDVKPGAAYISQVTQAPILPVGIGGAYLAEDAFTRFKRPQITITFGEVMPAVPSSENRKNRDADLEAASAEIMGRILDLLPPEDQARHDRWNRETYDLGVAFRRDGETLKYDGPPLPDMTALGEFVAKPNLFRPMWQNARLDVEPFLEARFFAPIEIKIVARVLYDALKSGDYEEYLAYRMGDAKAAQVLAELQTLRA